MKKGHDEYDEIYKLDMEEEWLCGAYDEAGEAVFCDICGNELKWNRMENEWQCSRCGESMNRAEYFEYIGAAPPGVDCITNCCENYPFCKKKCDRYSFDPEDPMIT